MVGLSADGETRNGLGDPRGVWFLLLKSLGGSDAGTPMGARRFGVQLMKRRGFKFVDRSQRMGSAVLGSLDGLMPGPLRIRLRLIGPLERRPAASEGP